jgi:hypothetical protein
MRVYSEFPPRENNAADAQGTRPRFATYRNVSSFAAKALAALRADGMGELA